MNKKSRVVAYCMFAGLFIFGVVLYLVNLPDGELIKIQSGENVIEIIDISTVSQSYEKDIYNNGYNKIQVSKNGVKVIEADCPDKLCMEQSERGIYPIVCLPHELVINIENRR